MPTGHVNRATINQRYPLTKGMRDLLQMVIAKGRHQEIIMTGTEKNLIRGLLNRGYVTWHIEFRGYKPTDAGRKALSEINSEPSS